MKNCIKTELWKATHDKMFLLSLLLGLIVCIIQVVQVAIDVNALIPGILSDAEMGGNPGYTGISIFFNWIGIDGYYFGSRLFFFLWPIFVALPFGWSYAKERKDGVYNQIVTRCGTKQYFIAKYLAVFTTGGLALVIPVLLNLLILAMFCPYDVLTIMSGANIFNYHFMSALFYTKPWIYALVWCGIQFLWGGAVACLCFVAGTLFRLSILTILFPFASLFIIDSLYTMLRSSAIVPQLYNLMLSPIQLAQPIPLSGAANPAWAIFGILGLLIAVSFLIGYRQVVKRELV